MTPQFHKDEFHSLSVQSIPSKPMCHSLLCSSSPAFPVSRSLHILGPSGLRFRLHISLIEECYEDQSYSNAALISDNQSVAIYCLETFSYAASISYNFCFRLDSFSFYLFGSEGIRDGLDYFGVIKDQ